ncbi:alkane 1-monooxygenase [Mycolicibacterium sphagni]|uniref:Alkane 1-monooxygenase n=1 Tax=Mycolicibacterium sphagni TaxID=1786 RepID=A0A255DL12_9MYCO|nr:alkane 1-monooxygenase [Mycolicibacterium sphagni]OYN79954.1 alkane 1-monooxygenase [Mycolicibacterium sphagni]
MPSVAPANGWLNERSSTAAPHWRDPKRHLWLLGTIVPGLVGLSWLGADLTGEGAFWWCGALITFVVMPAMDHLVGADSDGPSDDSLAWLEADPFYRWATYLYLPCQYLSLVFACWLWAGGGWLTMGPWDKVGLMITVGFVGGCAINVAHQLGHTRAGSERRLAKIALAQSCYGHFFVEHNRGHHVRVATPEDPASSRLGESLYAFIPRSVVGSAVSAWRIEARRLARRGRSRWTLRNGVLNAWVMSAALFSGLVLWFGAAVLPWLLGQAIVGVCLLETVNYMEHYGLRRQKLPNGRYEQVRPEHSWNSDTMVANVFLFHLQRHSDHHANPLRPYQALRHRAEAPQLPAGYGSMMLIALIPPLWRRIMDYRVLRHYGGDIRLAGLSRRAEAAYTKRGPAITTSAGWQ